MKQTLTWVVRGKSPRAAIRLPDENTILRFRHLLEKYKLAEQILVEVNVLLRAGTVVDATLIAAPTSTKNASSERDPELHPTKKGYQWHFRMKAHIGVDAASGLVHTVRGTASSTHDVVEANARKRSSVLPPTTPATRSIFSGQHFPN